MNWFTRETQALHIARSPEADNALVWRHPNANIARGAQLVVRSDERAVFFRQGVAVGVLEAGTYKLDSANIPFLGTLVNMLTGGNHYLAELFFVRIAETRRDMSGDDLGTYRDRASQHLVRMNFSTAFTFRVSDPIAFITMLGGQSASSEAMAISIVDGRIRNAVRSIVGKHAQNTPILDVVSNSHTEEFGHNVRGMIAPEFAQQGVEFVRFLELYLDLDTESRGTLQEYQSRVADLTIQAQGAQIAQDPGFAAFNLVQGQKNLLDGMGAGLSQGVRGPIFGLGMGVPGMAGMGMVSLQSAPRAPTSPPVGRATTAAPIRYFIIGERGPEGPYDAKRLVLVVLSTGKRLEDIRIRQEGEPSEIAISAMDEPAIRQEFERRSTRTSTSAVKGDLGVFEQVFEAAVKDRVLSEDEIAMLAPLAVRAKLAVTEADARTVIASRARAIGCTLGGPASSASGGTEVVYSYSVDGGDPETGLDARAIAQRLTAAPSRKHWVWRPGFDAWRAADGEADIREALATEAPPPPGAAAPPLPPPPPA